MLRRAKWQRWVGRGSWLIPVLMLQGFSPVYVAARVKLASWSAPSHLRQRPSKADIYFWAFMYCLIWFSFSLREEGMPAVRGLSQSSTLWGCDAAASSHGARGAPLAPVQYCYCGSVSSVSTMKIRFQIRTPAAACCSCWHVYHFKRTKMQFTIKWTLKKV